MTSPFSDPESGSGFPPPPPGGAIPPPPQYASAPPPPGYQAYTPYVGAQGLPKAGFGARLAGYLLDNILYGLLGVALAIPGIVVLINSFDGCRTINGSTVCPTGEPNGGEVATGIFLIFIAVVVIFVIYIRALGRTGQTWGRKIAGIRVVRESTGEPIGIGRAIGRQLFAGFISGQIFYLGYLWMLWDDKKQTWHDKVVNSIVVSA